MEKYKLKITSFAKADIESALEYLDKFSRDTSLRYSKYIYDAIHSLVNMPERCTFVRDKYLREKGYRWISARNYIIYLLLITKPARSE